MKLLPKTLFGRMLLIIVTPLILVQVITVLIFYERHWDTITRYMANNLAADVSVVVDRLATDESTSRLDAIQKFAWSYFLFNVTWHEGDILKKSNYPEPVDYGGKFYYNSLKNRLHYPFAVDLDNSPDQLTTLVQLPDGVVHIQSSRKRIFSSTSWLFILWTISSSVLLFFIALIFLRGQVRPIRRLAKAARQLGLGRQPHDYKLEGTHEVRLAGLAFKAMHQRIQRQMAERTEMLAGVSHDLRTPLTRMKLQVEYLPKGTDKDGMQKDIADMEMMIKGYLDFASNAVSENTQPTDIQALITDSISSFNLPASRLSLTPPTQKIPPFRLRQNTLRRAIDNLISNAIRHAEHCTISLEQGDDQVQIVIDDDGPGIPKDQRINVLRPFVRLDNESEHGTEHGTGLGLSIANDVALSHGGNLLLGTAPSGGLRVRLQLPI